MPGGASGRPMSAGRPRPVATSTRSRFRFGRPPVRRPRRRAAPPVVIISEEIARRFFPNESPVGQQVRGGDGHARDRRRGRRHPPRVAHRHSRAPTCTSRSSAVQRRRPRCSCGPPAIPCWRCRRCERRLRSLEPNLVDLRRAHARMTSPRASAAITRLAMRLLAGFAVVALVLAAIGIYGVMAYSVRRRTREIGHACRTGREPRRHRAARDATGRGDYGRRPRRRTRCRPARAAQSLSAVLYDVPPSDPLALSVAAVVLAATAMAACYLPARRAARVDPARTLSTE